MFAEGYIRRHQRLISLIQLVLDALLISLAFLLAYQFYQGSIWQMPASYRLCLLLGVLFFYVAAVSTGLYRSWRGDQLLRHYSATVQTWAMAVLALVILGWALKVSDHFSRVVMGSWVLATPILLGVSRLVVRAWLVRIRKQGRNLKRIALVGSGSAAEAFLQELERNPWMGYQLDQHYTDDFKGLSAAARAHQFDEIFIALPMSHEETIRQLLQDLSDCSVPVHIIPDLFIFNLMSARMTHVGNMPAISVFDSPHDDLSALIKRSEDIVLASLILVLISPLLLGLAIAIKCTSKGPVLFKQRRYGIGGEEIIVWKFRSMTVCEDGSEIRQAQKNDQRITPLGAFMRRTSLDELPQFINVLQGRMSIVGPRPHAVAHNELYRKDISGYMLRHLVKPGITGWAQVNGWRGETDTLDKMEKRVEFDLYYIRNWSLWMDLNIVFLTIFKGFVNRNAY